MRYAIALVSVVVALLTGVVSAQRADAGTYVMRNCDVPGYANSLIGPWEGWGATRRE